MGECDIGMRGGKTGINLDGTCQQPACLDAVTLRHKECLLAPTQEEGVGLHVACVLSSQSPLLFGSQPNFERRNNLLRKLILHCKNIGEITIEAFGPDVCATYGVNELASNSNPITGFSHAALEHVANTELSAYLFHIDGLALVGECRVAGDHVQFREPRQISDDVFADPVGKVFLLCLSTHVVEREDRDRWFVENGKHRP